MLFDQIGLKHKCLDLVIDNDKLKISDEFDQIASFRIEVSAGLEILPDAATQILGFADIDDLAGGIFMDIDARGCGQIF